MSGAKYNMHIYEDSDLFDTEDDAGDSGYSHHDTNRADMSERERNAHARRRYERLMEERRLRNLLEDSFDL